MISRSISLLAAVFALSASAASLAQDETLAQLEQKQAFRQIGEQARLCEGDEACFRAHVRPFGPWVVALGGRQGSADPAFAAEVTNFAFGVAGGQAGVDPIAVSKALFCGKACMNTRMAELGRRHASLRQVAEALSRSGVLLVALWPEGKIRANDCVIDGADVRCIRRTPELGLFQGWTAGEAVPAGTISVKEVAAVAALLRRNGLAAVVQDEGGGVRVIHSDSLAENEVGLLFSTSPPARGAALPDGSSYSVINKVADGVFAYLRV